jgi:hypothetical protein
MRVPFRTSRKMELLKKSIGRRDEGRLAGAALAACAVAPISPGARGARTSPSGRQHPSTWTDEGATQSADAHPAANAVRLALRGAVQEWRGNAQLVSRLANAVALSAGDLQRKKGGWIFRRANHPVPRAIQRFALFGVRSARTEAVGAASAWKLSETKVAHRTAF